MKFIIQVNQDSDSSIGNSEEEEDDPDVGQDDNMDSFKKHNNNNNKYLQKKQSYCLSQFLPPNPGILLKPFSIASDSISFGTMRRLVKYYDSFEDSLHHRWASQWSCSDDIRGYA